MELQLVVTASTTAPDWWERMTHRQQSEYLARHPRSRLKKFLKKPASKKATPEPQAKVKRKPAKMGSGDVKQIIDERKRREEESKIAEVMLPAIRQSVKTNITSFSRELDQKIEATRAQISPADRSELADFLTDRKAGIERESRGFKVSKKILVGITQAALGLGMIAAIASGAAPLAGALTAAFFGLNDYRKGMQDKDLVKSEPKGRTIEGQYTVSESSGDDPIEVLVQDYMLWLGNQDLDAISEKLAQYGAVLQLEEEGWQPDVHKYDDQDLTDLADSLTEDGDQGLLSESASIRPRISFRCCDRTRRPDLRKEYDIVFADRVIGKINCQDAFASRNKRIWRPELYDGFNEAIYKSGIDDLQPYTLVTVDKIVLRNPVPTTFSECCAWVKQNIDVKFL